MSDRAALEGAVARLNAALDRLDSAVQRRAEKDRQQALSEIQLQMAHDDRARLAADLEACNARSATLERVNRDIARRIDLAMDTIRSVLKSQGI